MEWDFELVVNKKNKKPTEVQGLSPGKEQNYLLFWPFDVWLQCFASTDVSLKELQNQQLYCKC